jgi:archaellum component FlaC
MANDDIDNENLEIDSEEAADAALESIAPTEGSPILDDKPAAAPVDEFDLTVGGKQIKAKRDQLVQWAQQGYNAPTQISKLTKEIDTWKKQFSDIEPKYKELESKFSQYNEIDSYVRQNPAFWDHVQQAWQNRTQALNDQSNPLAQMVSQLQSEVQGLVQYKTQIEEQQAKYRETKEDQEYLQSFEELKKQHSDIDFVTPDEEGKTLEYRVLEHAQMNGIKNFKTAFRDFYHDELVKRAESRAKESFVKDKQKNTKLGILGITNRPTKTVSTDFRGKSYDDLADEAKQELGLT